MIMTFDPKRKGVGQNQDYVRMFCPVCQLAAPGEVCCLRLHLVFISRIFVLKTDARYYCRDYFEVLRFYYYLVPVP